MEASGSTRVGRQVRWWGGTPAGQRQVEQAETQCRSRMFPQDGAAGPSLWGPGVFRNPHFLLSTATAQRKAKLLGSPLHPLRSSPCWPAW